MALVLRDGLALLALVALFVVRVNQSERTAPRWLRRRGYPPGLYLETKEGRRRLKQLTTVPSCIVDATLDVPWP